MKQKFLEEYCKSLINYFKAKNIVSSFQDSYNEELEELNIQHLKSLSTRKGYRNAIAITVGEQDRYYQEVSGSTATSALHGFQTTQETADFPPEDSNVTRETTDSTPKSTLTVQNIVDSTDNPTASNFRKAGYQYVSMYHTCILFC